MVLPYVKCLVRLFLSLVVSLKSLFFIRSCYLPSFTKVVWIRERVGSSSYSPSFCFGPTETKNPLHGDLNPGCAMLFYRSLLQLSRKHCKRGDQTRLAHSSETVAIFIHLLLFPLIVTTLVSLVFVGAEYSPFTQILGVVFIRQDFSLLLD